MQLARRNGTHLTIALATLLAACGSDEDDAKDSTSTDSLESAWPNGEDDTAPAPVAGMDTIALEGPAATEPEDGGAGEPRDESYPLPEEFIESEFGAYALGDELIAGAPPPSVPTLSEGGCGTEIIGVVRDFKRGDQVGGHPDFETFTGSGEKGIVADALGDDLKPVYVEGEHLYTTTKDAFDQWYRNVDGVNRAYLAFFSFEPNGDVLTFESNAFFPLDDAGFGNQEHDHNFGFTTEIHTEFKYNGGETFRFTGDDDLWVFINRKLAIDLGGLHASLSEEVSLDESADQLGLVVGNNYALDLFHAERHTSDSNFRVDTNLEFTNCEIVIDIPVR